MDIETKTNKGIQIKSSWVTVFILIATLVLVVIQAWNIFYGQEPQEYNLAQASEFQDLATQTSLQEVLTEQEIMNQNYQFRLESAEDSEGLLRVNFSYQDYDVLEGKVYPAFYFDEFVDLESSYIYYGQSPADLSASITPIEAKKVCALLVSANLQILENTENCLELEAQQIVTE